MAKNTFREASGKLLNSTEKEALAKLKKIHEPMLKELEKWKDQREKLETTLFDQIQRIGKFLEPYQDPARVQQTLMGLAGQKQPRAQSPKKKTTSSKKSAAPKPSAKRSTKAKSGTAKKSR
jgi:hypothetical protein